MINTYSPDKNSRDAESISGTNLYGVSNFDALLHALSFHEKEAGPSTIAND